MIKDGYKKTSIGYIPLDWEVKKFKDITAILRCGLASTPKYVEDGVPFLSAQNVKNGKLNLDKYKCISNELHEKLTKNTKPQKNDILMTRVGNVGDAALVDIDWEFSVYVSLTHIRMKEGYDSQFFTQLLNSSFIKRRSLQTQYKGGGVANLNVKVVEEFDMPIPPLKEQQKIAEILSSVDTAIEKTEQVIAKTEEVKKGLMQQLLAKGIGHTEFERTEIGEIPVEWEVRKLGELFPNMCTGATPSRKIKEYYAGDIPWISSGELKYKTIIDTVEKITIEAVKDTNLKIYPVGTFFIAITGLEAAGTRGSCAITGIEATTNQSCLSFVPNDNINNKYLYYWYLLNGENIAFQYAQGTKQQSLNINIVAGIPLAVPSLYEQEKIVNILETQDKMIESEEEKLNRLKVLKQGLMQQLLTGQVRVKTD